MTVGNGLEGCRDPVSGRDHGWLKIYKKPHTGEVVETNGGNHKTLKEWKAEHGSATVESWLTK